LIRARTEKRIISLDLLRAAISTAAGIIVGTLDETGDFPTVYFGADFMVWMCAASAPRLSTLKGKPVVQLEFTAQTVPWLLAEPELE